MGGQTEFNSLTNPTSLRRSANTRTNEGERPCREASQLQAVLNMLRTVFVCIVLGMGAMLFSKDANDLVLKPIERMVKKVREVSENPLTRFEVHEVGG